MQRKRILAVALAWMYPPVFVAATVLLTLLDWLPNSGWMALAMLCLGPIAFTVLLSCLLLNRSEEPEVRYARASRRLGYMCKLSALGVMAISLPAINYVGEPPQPFLSGSLQGLWFFLLASMVTLMLAALFFHAGEADSAEPGGAKDAFIVTAVILPLVFFMIMNRHPVHPVVERKSCSHNLKQLGLTCKMFAREHDGRFPELSPEPGYLSIFNGENVALYPEYMSDCSLLTCPMTAHSKNTDDAQQGQEAFDASSYVYLGYIVQSSEELETFFECYRERIAAGLPFNEDLPAPPGRGSGGGDKILRLREGAEMVYVTDKTNPAASAIAQSKIPVMFDRNPENHIPGGVNVLYMDGHIEFRKYPEQWPATPKTFAIIEAIESLRPAASRDAKLP